MTSDDLGNLLTRVITFHDFCMTLTTNGEDILITLKTNRVNTLMAWMTCGEDTLKTLVTTCNYPL